MHANVLLTGEVVERPQALSGQRRMKVKVSLTEKTERGEETSVLWHYVTFTDQQVTKTTQKRPNELHSTNKSQGLEKSSMISMSFSEDERLIRNHMIILLINWAI